MKIPAENSFNANSVRSLYLHFPYCKHLCNYCDFYKLKMDEKLRIDQLEQLKNYLKKSYHAVLDLLSQNENQLDRWETIYFGGGTPSLWGEEGIYFLHQWFQQENWQLAKNCEWTLEADPGTVTEKLLHAWMDLGVNRFSIGVQTLNENIFPLMDRSHTLPEVFSLLSLMQKNQCNFSADFMLGLPQSAHFQRSILEELNKLLSFEPQHISLYFLSVEKNYRHFDRLPSEDWIAKEYDEVVNFLTAKGFNHYEVASFALPGHESQHNQKYWNHQSVLALGPSGTGFLRKTEKHALRYKWNTSWLKDTSPTWVAEDLSEEHLSLEKIYLLLRQGRGFNTRQLEACGIPLKLGQKVYSEWQNSGYLIELIPGHWKMTHRGWLVLDSLVGQLLTLKH